MEALQGASKVALLRALLTCAGGLPRNTALMQFALVGSDSSKTRRNGVSYYMRGNPRVP